MPFLLSSLHLDLCLDMDMNIEKEGMPIVLERDLLDILFNIISGSATSIGGEDNASPKDLFSDQGSPHLFS